jgi:3-hydroxyisobutyrate dehydrogenase-like beta-hydroxyacid dehydrogenase
MGAAFADRLAAIGDEVTLYNRTPSKALALSGPRVAVADSVVEALSRASHVLLTLSDASAIESVLMQPGALAVLPGRTIIQMGTILPAESEALADEVNAAGADYLEAPVLGSTPEAREGRLIVMVGGTEAQFQREQLLLRRFGSEPRLVGPVGKAAALKLAFNQLIASLTAGFAFSLGLVKRRGVDVELFMDLLRSSALYAPTFDKKLSRMLSGDFANPNFPTKHLQKDLSLALAEGRTLGLRTEPLEAIAALLQCVIDDGGEDADYSALYGACKGDT